MNRTVATGAESKPTLEERLKKIEVQTKEIELERLRKTKVNWALVAPILSAVLAAVFGIYKSVGEQRYQAQTTLIVEAIRTGVDNPGVAANNLRFFADAGLLDAQVAEAVKNGKYAVLPGPTPGARGEFFRDLDTDLKHLHPTARVAVSATLQDLSEAHIPIKLSEGFRSPVNQQILYYQGRVISGTVATGSPPWTSPRQYGLAVTFGILDKGSWTWDQDGEHATWWARLKEIAGKHHLVQISTDPAALELEGTKITELRDGHYPPDGDEDWANNLRLAIASWHGEPAAPPPP